MGVFREGGRQRELVLTSSRVEIRKGFCVGYQEKIKGPEAVVVEVLSGLSQCSDGEHGLECHICWAQRPKGFSVFPGLSFEAGSIQPLEKNHLKIS